MNTIYLTDEAFLSPADKLGARHVQMMPARKVSLAIVFKELARLAAVMFCLGAFLKFGMILAGVE